MSLGNQETRFHRTFSAVEIMVIVKMLKIFQAIEYSKINC